MDPQAVPQNQQAVSLDELYRKYGEATLQFKQAQFNVMQIEQQLQQIMTGQAIPVK